MSLNICEHLRKKPLQIYLLTLQSLHDRFLLYSLLDCFFFLAIPKDFDCLSLPAPSISESCIKLKIELNFYLHASLWSLKRFCEDF